MYAARLAWLGGFVPVLVSVAPSASEESWAGEAAGNLAPRDGPTTATPLPSATATPVQQCYAVGIRSDQLRSLGIRLMLVGADPQTLGVFRRSGAMELFGEESVYPASDEVLGSLDRASADAETWIAARRSARIDASATPKVAAAG